MPTYFVKLHFEFCPGQLQLGDAYDLANYTNHDGQCYPVPMRSSAQIPISSPDELVVAQVFNSSVICSYAYVGIGEMQLDTFGNLEYQLC